MMSTYWCISTSNQLYTRPLQTDQETYDMPWIYVQLIMFWFSTTDNLCNSFSENFNPEIRYCFGVQLHTRARFIKEPICRRIKPKCQNGLRRFWLFDTRCRKCVQMVILSIIKAPFTIQYLWWLMVTFSVFDITCVRLYILNQSSAHPSISSLSSKKTWEEKDARWKDQIIVHIH